MALNRSEDGGELRHERHRQCHGEAADGTKCKDYGQWVLKSNWARHVARSQEHHLHDQVPAFSSERETCDKCNVSFAKGSRSRHNNSAQHLQRVAAQVEDVNLTSDDQPYPTIERVTRRNEETVHNTTTQATASIDTSLPIEEGTTRGDTSLTREEEEAIRQYQGPRSRSPTPDRTLQDEVFAATIDALQRSINAVQHVHDSLQATRVSSAGGKGRVRQRRRRETRLEFETPKYLTMLKSSVNVYPFSPDEYRRKRHDTSALHRAYVACTPAEARQLLLEDTLPVPLLVRCGNEKQESDADLSTIEDFLDYLTTKPGTVDVHRYHKATSRPDYNTPDAMATTEVAKIFRTIPTTPANVLNLGNVKDNPVPPFMVGIRSLKILKEVTEDNLIGKATTTDHADLASCTAFHILATAGVFSLPHLDHHGVITTATCDEGEKYWLTWPVLSNAELVAWHETDIKLDSAWAPTGQPFGIYLRRGDVLVQPRQRVHAPYSMTSVLMSGTMHWDSRDMLGILQASLIERENDSITNELPAKQFDEKIQMIDQLWKGMSRRYQWGTDQEREEWIVCLKRWLRSA